MLKTTKLIGKQSYSSVEQSISQKSFNKKRNPESDSTPLGDLSSTRTEVQDHKKDVKAMNRALKEIGKRASILP